MFTQDIVSRNRLVSVSEAATMMACSNDTIRRQFRERMVRISPRRVGIRLADLLDRVGAPT